MASSGGTETKNGSKLNKFAMFMVGFNLLFIFRLVITCAIYALKRFHLPLDNVGLFINQFNNPMALAYLIGFVISTAITISTSDKKDMHRYISIATNWSIVLCSIVLFFSYTTGGDTGHVTYYYWTIIINASLAGINYSFCVAVDPANIVFANLGLPLSGIFVFFYHWICMKIFKRYDLENIEFWLVVYQIIIMISITIAVSILWTIAHKEKGDKGNESGDARFDLSNAGTWSPLLMDFLSLGFLYVFVPAILPFQLVDPQTGYKIELINLFTTAIPAIVVCTLNALGQGPDNKWRDCHRIWHMSWILFFIPYICCMATCIITLHYPDHWIAKFVRSDSVVVGVLTITYITCEELLEDIGLAGVGRQGSGDKTNGTLVSFSVMSSLTLMTITMFISDGYLQTYRKADRENWPTQGYTRYRGFKFWFGSGIKVAKKNVKTAFTLDVRKTFLEKASVTE